MNAELLLEHFHRLGDAPDAVPRLRRFILDVAVRGKLVEQDERDEPAVQLLRRIEAAKLKAHKAGEVSKPKAIPELAPGEEPYTAPIGWCWTRVRHVTADRGQTIPKERFTYIDVTAINKEAGVVSDAQVLDAADAPSRARKVVGAGDVIYSCVRPYLLNVAVIDHEIDPSPIASTAFAVMHGFGLVVPKYLWIVMRSPFMIACVEERMRGQAYPSINDADFALLPFPLPPLPEQHRIVAKVEELMALCDRLEAAQQQREQERTRLTAAAWQGVVSEPATAPARFALEQLPALTTRPQQVKALRQTILDLAVRGRLTNVPSSQVQKEIKPFNAVTDPLRPIAYGVLKPGPHDPNGIRLVKSQHIRSWRVADEIQDRISPELDAEFKRTKLHGGEVLLNLVGASIGRSAVAPPSLRGANVSRAVAVIAVAKDVVADFVVILISALLTPERIAQEATGTAQPVLNLGVLRKLEVWLPSLAEQRRIVEKVEVLMALCDGLEAALQAGEELKAKALEAVLRSDDEMIRRSDNGLPAKAAPKAVKRTPHYAEAEVELAVAAEPAAHPGALQAVVRRGPGRPPTSGALTSTAARAIEAFLSAHPGWHGKSAILAATGTDAAAWNAAIKELLVGRKVERQGEKKGARYRGR